MAPDSPLPAGLSSGMGIDAMSTAQLMAQLGPFLGSGITTVTQRYERAHPTFRHHSFQQRKRTLCNCKRSTVQAMRRCASYTISAALQA